MVEELKPFEPKPELASLGFFTLVRSIEASQRLRLMMNSLRTFGGIVQPGSGLGILERRLRSYRADERISRKGWRCLDPSWQTKTACRTTISPAKCSPALRPKKSAATGGPIIGLARSKLPGYPTAGVIRLEPGLRGRFQTGSYPECWLAGGSADWMQFWGTIYRTIGIAGCALHGPVFCRRANAAPLFQHPPLLDRSVQRACYASGWNTSRCVGCRPTVPVRRDAAQNYTRFSCTRPS